MRALSIEQKQEFNKILEFLGESLDITKSQFDAAVKSYNAVASWLSRPDSELSLYKPEILPQGSFLLGTMIQSINKDDDLDLDLVCKLIGKRAEWTQYDVKIVVGDELKKHAIYQKLLRKPDGRRCWTIGYREESDNYLEKYHMDILPSIVDLGYQILIEKAITLGRIDDVKELAIRITDKERDDYFTQRLHHEWLKSNPFGYAQWFFQRASLAGTKRVLLSESIKPVPDYQQEKLPLQRIVQILKRHRDMMFNGSDDKPISIIITTLASKAYNGESDIVDGLINIVKDMHLYIGERYSSEHGKIIKWIENPVNPEENFADKWPEHPERERAFFQWLSLISKDLEGFIENIGSGINIVQEGFSKAFGDELANRTFHKYSESMKGLRERGALKIERGTGILSVGSGLPVKDHNFEGYCE